MANIKETSGVMGYVDEQGNPGIHYPVTKAENVEGLDDAIKAQIDATSSGGGPAAFSVNEAGHLILHYTGDAAPDYSINSDGHLILTL